MEDIYNKNSNLLDKAAIMTRIDEIKHELVQESIQPDEEYDHKKELDLLCQQLIQAMKLQ